MTRRSFLAILCVFSIFIFSEQVFSDNKDESFRYDFHPEPWPSLSNWKCFGCTLLAGVLKTAYFTSQSQDCLAAIVAKVCTVFQIENSQICDAISTQYKDEVLYVVGELLLNPRQFCGFMLQNCSDAYNPLNNTWTVPLPPRPSTNQVVKKTIQDAPTIRVLQLSDIHFDPHYVVGSEADCGYPLCCRDRGNEEGPIKNPAGKWGTFARCDIPLALLENLFQHLRDKEKFDYIIWTGDIPPHDVWNQSKSEQLDIYGQLIKLFKKYFPNKLIFSTVGNHESAPADSFPPHFKSLPQKYTTAWLYDFLADHWTNWLPESTKEAIKNKASYMVKIFPGLRLISINTNYCMATNFWLYLNDTDPDGDLTWLVEQLFEAEKAGDKVHIIGHTPSGDPNCLPQWSKNYYRIVNRFNDTITGQFFGHVHSDQFSVFYENADYKKRPTNVLYVSPSVTPFDVYMPAYRIYTIDGNHSQSTWKVLDYETFSANLTEANLKDKVEWKLEYKAKDAYNMKDLSPDSWSQLINRLLDNKTLAQTFLKHFYRSEIFECDRNCQLDTFCELRSGRSHHPSLCSDFPPRPPRMQKSISRLDLNELKSTFRFPFVPKECRPNWPWSKQVQLMKNTIKFSRSNGNVNCDTIKSECHSDQCGQICEGIVAAHSRLGQPDQLDRCRDAVCHVLTDCCNCKHYS